MHRSRNQQRRDQTLIRIIIFTGDYIRLPPADVPPVMAAALTDRRRTGRFPLSPDEGCRPDRIRAEPSR